MRLVLRAFADCESQESAQASAMRILLILSHLSPELSAKPKRYWKLPQLFELAFSLMPATEASFQSLVSRSSGGWEHTRSGNELSSVWNRKLDHIYLVPEVAWAEVQLYEAVA
jgi:hypothetical protein